MLNRKMLPSRREPEVHIEYNIATYCSINELVLYSIKYHIGPASDF